MILSLVVLLVIDSFGNLIEFTNDTVFVSVFCVILSLTLFNLLHYFDKVICHFLYLIKSYFLQINIP